MGCGYVLCIAVGRMVLSAHYKLTGKDVGEHVTLSVASFVTAREYGGCHGLRCVSLTSPRSHAICLLLPLHGHFDHAMLHSHVCI